MLQTISQESAGYDQPTGIEEGEEEEFEHEMQALAAILIRDEDGKGFTPPKSNTDTQNDGFLDVSPFKHGYFWYLC